MKNLLLILLILIAFVSYGRVTASFTCSTTHGCAPLSISMTSTSGGQPTSHHWELGNGNSSSMINPSATFFNPGTYVVTLIVSDGTSSDSVSRNITVYAQPTVNLTSDKNRVCSESPVSFTNHIVIGSAPITQYAWDFGNGIANPNSNVIYRYPQPGTYDVTLVVADTNGCTAHITRSNFITVLPKPLIDFTVTPQTICAPSQIVSFTNQSTGSNLSYLWRFGDGDTSVNTNPTHLYQAGRFKPTLIATNSYGCTDSLYKKVSIINPQAIFSASKTRVCVGEPVTFTSPTLLPGILCHWYFGDGQRSVKLAPQIIYPQPGVYDVTLVIKDSLCSDSLTIPAYITVSQGFNVSFTSSTRRSCTAPFPVSFSVNAPPGISYSWSFGDGYTDSIATPTPTHTYTSAGSFQVILTAMDTSGCTVVLAEPGYVSTTKPDVKFSVLDTILCLGCSVHFYNWTPNGMHYHWDFGDGDTSDQFMPRHTYRHCGHFDVSLTAWDSIGCDSTLVHSGYIHIDTAKVDFTVDHSFSMCPPLVSVFHSTVNRSDIRYHWDFGDGNTDTVPNPSHVYFHPGTYTVRLIGIAKQGCADTVTYRDIIQVQGPTGSFSMTPTSGCIPLHTDMRGTMSNNVQSILCDMGDGTVYNDSINFDYTYHTARTFHPIVLLTDHIGCSVAYRLDSITTLSGPDLHLRDTAICPGQSVDIHLTSARSIWTQTIHTAHGDSTVPNRLCDTCRFLTLSPSVSTAYTVTASQSSGCSSYASMEIDVIALPIVPIHDSIKVCSGHITTLSPVYNASNIAWSPAKYLNSIKSSQPLCTPASTQEYTVTAYNRLGCSASGAVTVIVPQNTGQRLARDTTVCPESSITLRSVDVNTDTETQYTWLPGPGLDYSSGPEAMISASTLSHIYKVLVSKSNCIIDTEEITVSVASAANVVLPRSIMAVPDIEITLSPVSGNLTSYSWSATDTPSCRECSNPLITPQKSQYVYLHGANSYGCQITDSMYIHVSDCDPRSIFVPNTFTPNNDGQNDNLYVRSKTLSHLEYVRIYNRWGAIVYESKDINEGWDGTIAGLPSPQGVYVYQVSGRCKSGYEITTSGTVTIVR